MLCLDTNTVIYSLNQRRPAVRERLVAAQTSSVAIIIPAIVLFELYYGLAKSSQPDRSRALLDAFLSGPFVTPAFDDDDAREAGAIRAGLERSGTPIGAYDVLIAAQARRRGATLVTSNPREFVRVPGLIVIDWAEP